MSRVFVLQTIALLLLLGAAAGDAAGQSGNVDVAQGSKFEVAVVLWWLSPDVVLRADADDIAGTRIDFVREFDVGRHLVPEIRAALILNRRHRVRFDFTPISYSGVRNRPLDLVFQGQTFSGSQPASTRLKWNMFQLSYEWQFAGGDHGSLGLVGEINFTDAEAAISGGGRTSSVTQRLPLPVFGLIGKRHLTPALSFSGELSGFKIFESFQLPFVGHLIQLDLYPTYEVSEHVRLRVGYRLVDIAYTTSQKERRKAIVDEDTGSLTFAGLYAGAVVRF